MACTQARREGFHSECTNRSKEEEKCKRWGTKEVLGKAEGDLEKSNRRLMDSRENSSNDLISRMLPAKHTNFSTCCSQHGERTLRPFLL